MTRKKTKRGAGDAPQGLEFHPLADLFPLLEGAEFDELVDDVRSHGIHEAIWLYEAKILEGRNRYRAAAVAGVACPTRLYEGDDPVGFVISMNIKRRHLDASQRAMIARRLAALQWGQRQSGKFAALPTQEAAADLFNVSQRSVRHAAVVRHKGVQELQQAVERGQVSASAAANIASLPANEQRRVVAKGEREMRTAAKRVRSTRPTAPPRRRLGRPQDEKTIWRSRQEACVRAAIAGAEFDDWLRFQVDDELVALVEQASRAWAKVFAYLERASEREAELPLEERGRP
jgi:hypothetical protein